MGSVSFLYIYITGLITSVDPQVVSARLGSTAVLPCELSHASKPTVYVQWRTDSAVVFERTRKDSYQGERFKGRVDVPEKQLLEGNCSLVLKNVCINDAGIYYSYLFVKHRKRSVTRFIQRVELEVYVIEQAGTTFSQLFLVFSLLCLFYFLFYTVKKKLSLEVKISRRCEV